MRYQLLAAISLSLAPAASAQLTLNPGSFLGVDTEFSAARTLVQIDPSGAITDSLPLTTVATGAAVGVEIVDGRVFVASVFGEIEEVDLSTGTTTLVAATGSTYECFSSANGELYTHAWTASEIVRYDTNGAFLGTIPLSLGLSATGFDATDDELFFASWGSATIEVFDSTGVQTQTITHSLGGSVVSSMAYNQITDTFFICTGFGSDQIHEVDRNGVTLQTFPAPVAWMNGVTIVDGGGLGMNYCGPAVANSTGQPGVIEGLGSAVVANNDFSVRASQLPEGAFAFFIVSATQDFVVGPGGSSGNLCLGGSVGRFAAQVGQVAGGMFEIQVDLTGLPVPPTFNLAVQSGDTWNFQLWHRDAGMPATSNFTNGLSVTFQ